MTTEKGMKSIWYFVGLILFTMGILVFMAGILDYISPPQNLTVLACMHTSAWWGIVMIVVGLIFFLKSRKETVS